jgi:hypothetical protein
MMTLAQFLERWTSETLLGYFNLLGGKKLTRKGERIDYICQQMLSAETLPGIWQRLDPQAQRAVSSAYHNEGVFDTAAFLAQYGQLPPRPDGNKYYYMYSRKPVLFDLFVIDNQVPADLMPLLANLVLPVERFQLEGIEKPPATITQQRTVCRIHQADTEMVGRADLLTYLRLVEQGALAWGATNRELTAGSVRKLYNNLLAGDFHAEPEKLTGRHVIRPFGLAVFARGAGLVTNAGQLSPAGREYLQSQSPTLFLEAFERWVEKGDFDELTRITELRGLNARGTRLSPPTSRREKVIEALSWCPTATWLPIQDFYRAVKIWQFDFRVELTDWRQLYAGPYKEYGYMSEDDYWFIVHGLYINAVIMEYLATIGAVDVAYVSEDISMVKQAGNYIDSELSLHDGLLYFRINKWGAFLLGQADEYVPTLPPQRELFAIDETLQVRVLSDLLPNEQLQLNVLAEPIQANVYRLSTEKLLTAVESGQEFDHLAGFLTRNHHGTPPQPVIEWLARLKQNVKAFKEGATAVMIQLKQPGLLALIEGDAALSKLCRPLDDKTVLVPASNLKRFRQRLKELGYLLS